MLFGAEGRFDKWKGLCDVCIREKGLKLWKVDSEDDFAMCYNMLSTDKSFTFHLCRLECYTINNVKHSRFESRLVHYGYVQYQEKLIETHAPHGNCDTMIPRCSSY